MEQILRDSIGIRMQIFGLKSTLSISDDLKNSGYPKVWCNKSVIDEYEYLQNNF
jgi:hypothetical protein